MRLRAGRAEARLLQPAVAAALAAALALAALAVTAPPAPADCTITGTAESDTIEGTEGDDVICGDDILCVFHTDGDVLHGGPGDDWSFVYGCLGAGFGYGTPAR